MTVELHGDRAGGRTIGPPRSGRMGRSRDPVEVAQAVRQLALSGAWRTVPAQGNDTDRLIYLLRARSLTDAVDLFPRAALAALTRRPPSPGCAWDTARMFAALDNQPLPAPTEATRALLGEPCPGCAEMFRLAATVQRLIDEDNAYRQALPATVQGRPHLAAALTAGAQPRPPGTPPPLYRALMRDTLKMGAVRAGRKWNVDPRFLLGDRTAARQLAQHPVFGVALRRPPGTPWPPPEAVMASLTQRAPTPAYYRRRPWPRTQAGHR